MERLSTISNAVYASAGLWVLVRSSLALHAMLGVSLILLGIGSALYHGNPKSISKRPTYGQRADEIGMYLAMVALIANLAQSVLPAEPVYLHASLWAMFGLAAWHDDLDSGTVIPVLGAFAALLLGIAAGPWWALGFVAWYGGAALIRASGEVAKRDLDHHVHDRLHTVWHLMTGTAFAAMWALVWLR